MDYGQIFKRGWEIWWSHKFLWLLGVLAALGGSSASGAQGQVNFSFPSGGSGGGASFPPFDPEFQQFFETLSRGQLPAQLPGWVEGLLTTFIGLICCLFLFFIVMYFVRLAAEGGMIHAVVAVESGQKSGLGQAFSQGTAHILSFWGVRLLLALPILIIVFILVLAVIPVGSSIVNGPPATGGIPAGVGLIISLFFCFTCLFVPYSLMIGLLIPLSQRGIALQYLGAIDSLRHAWAILRANAAEVLVLAVIYMVGGIIVSFALGLLLLPIIFATAAPIFFALIGGESPAFWQYGLAGVGVIVTIILGSIFNGGIVSFRSTTFTLAYLQFVDKMGLAMKGEPGV